MVSLSVLLARMFSVLYLVVGVGMFVSAKYYRKQVVAMLESVVALYLGALLALVAGFFIISFHNTWTADWTVLVTIFGWLAFAKGALFLMLPTPMIKWSRAWFANEKTIAWGRYVVIVIGMLFGYFGWLA